MFDPKRVRQDFPIFSQPAEQRLVYLDNAATSQKPHAVIDAITQYYTTANANVHRGVHKLSDRSTHVWETSRAAVAHFFGAQPDELILTRNTTEALNGVAYGWGETNIHEGDVILTTILEHHANIVPWQRLAARKNARVVCIKLTADGRIDLENFSDVLKKYDTKIKLIAVAHVSNALGTLVPVAELVERVHAQFTAVNRPRICLDGAQSAPHIPINFASLAVDFFAFSGHKMLGPMGVGGLIVKQELLACGQVQPWLFGGGMIATVSCETTTFAESLSERFTPGTPDVASAAGLAAACSYLRNLGMENVQAHDRELVEYALEQLSKIPAVTIIGPLQKYGADTVRVGSVSFVYEGVHAHDVAQVLDSEGVAVRSGHHCTMPLHTNFGWQASVRVSFSVYTAKEDIDVLVQALAKVAEVFGS